MTNPSQSNDELHDDLGVDFDIDDDPLAVFVGMGWAIALAIVVGVAYTAWRAM